jgi:hypothetical protein
MRPDRNRQRRASHKRHRSKAKRDHVAAAVSRAIREVRQESQADLEWEWLATVGMLSPNWNDRTGGIRRNRRD